MRRFTICLASAGVLASAAAAAPGQTVLDFFDAGYPGNQAFVDEQAGYGDNAPATPNVTATFEGLQLWDTGYGNLTNVAYTDALVGGVDRPDADATGSVTLTADPGFLVVLNSVDLAGFGGGQSFEAITVTGGTTPFSQTNVAAPETGRNTLDFGGLSGQQLVITFDDANAAESAGIDNLSFSQVVVPEPATLAVPALLSATGLLARRRRR